MVRVPAGPRAASTALLRVSQNWAARTLLLHALAIHKSAVGGPHVGSLLHQPSSASLARSLAICTVHGRVVSLDLQNTWPVSAAATTRARGPSAALIASTAALIAHISSEVLINRRHLDREAEALAQAGYGSVLQSAGLLLWGTVAAEVKPRRQPSLQALAARTSAADRMSSCGKHRPGQRQALLGFVSRA
jgi:hypothetical protein